MDLGKNFLVYAVTMTNRASAGYRLSDFEIFISPSENLVEERGATCDGRQGVDLGATRAIFCKQPLRGRYVATVSRLQEVLTFCEVSIQGWEDGRLDFNRELHFHFLSLSLAYYTFFSAYLID